MAAVASTSKTREIHFLASASSPSSPGGIADTDFSPAPPCPLGHVLRDVVWHILYSRRKYDLGARIFLSHKNVKDAFRQVAVEWEQSQTFGYVSRGMILVDRRHRLGGARAGGGVPGLFA